MEYSGPINPNPKDGESRISIYLYEPWLSGALVGAITFGIAMIVQVAYMKKRGTRWIHGLLAFGCLMEVGGYAARVRGHANPYLVNIFVVQYFLIVVAPIPLAAAIYLVLSYVVQRFPEGRSLLGVKPRLLVASFVFMDIVTIAIQVCGAALVGVVQTKKVRGENPSISTETAGHILLAGLAIQTFFFSIFLGLLIVAITRIRRMPQLYRSDARKVLLIDLSAALLVLLRTVYRLAVECQGYFGPANSSQILFTCLEYLPVILALVIFCIVPLGRFFPSEAAPADYGMNQISHGESEVKDHY